MNDRRDRRPDFEFAASVRAQEATFRVVGEVECHTEGTARVERIGRREGLPRPARPYIRYTGIYVSTHIRAWLEDPA